jgi:hypothetical protein
VQRDNLAQNAGNSTPARLLSEVFAIRYGQGFFAFFIN